MKTPTTFLADLMDMVRNKTHGHRRRLLRKHKSKNKPLPLVNNKILGPVLNTTTNSTDAAPSIDVVVSSDHLTDALTKRIVYLSSEDQLNLGAALPFINVIPWNSFARKNIGYLYAITHGAKYIWDFDDDNQLDNEEVVYYPFYSFELIGYFSPHPTPTPSFFPYSFF